MRVSPFFSHPDDGGLALVLLRLGLHDGEDTLGAGYGGQNGVHLLADLAHRLGHLLDVQQDRPPESPISNTPPMASSPPTQQVTA